MKKFLFFLLQCTWGLPQTLLGFIIFLKYRKCPHKFYRGAIDTQWSARGGMSLGLFIFTPPEDHPNSQKVRVHEYGHCFQSILLGPLYLLVIGLVSICWARIGYFVRLRKEKNIPYVACYTESWASKWGELFTGEEATWH